MPTTPEDPTDEIDMSQVIAYDDIPPSPYTATDAETQDEPEEAD